MTPCCNDIAPIVPVLIVTLAACAVLLAESFRRQDERDAGRAGSALIGLVGAHRRRRSLLWDRDAHRLRRHRRRQLHDLLQHHDLRDRPADDPALVGHGRARSAADGRVLRADAVLDRRHDADGRDARPARHLHRARDHVARRLRADRHQAQRASRAPRRRSSTSCSARSRARSSSTASRSPTRSPARPSSTSSACASPASAREPSMLLVLAMVLLLVGFAFKVSAVPFHMWTPDAYQGAPTLVTGFMSTGVKAAAFAAFVRVFLSAFEPLHVRVGAGALGDRRPHDDARARSSAWRSRTSSACSRTRASRTPAICSSASSPANAAGKAAILFYLVAYAVTNLGAFGVLAALSTPIGRTTTSATSPASGHERPGLAALLTVFLLSLGGFPPTVGFVAKWYIFNAARAAEPDRARHSRRAHERRLRLLLPAHRRHDVHDRRKRAGPSSRAGADGAAWG